MERNEAIVMRVDDVEKKKNNTNDWPNARILLPRKKKEKKGIARAIKCSTKNLLNEASKRAEPSQE